MLMKKIEELKKHQLNCNVFSVYDYCGVSIQELLCQFYTKINECVDISNKTINLTEWLVNEGLSLEVAKKLDLWLQDGTIQSLLNEKIFNELNEKIRKNTNDILEIKEQLNNKNVDLPIYTTFTNKKSLAEMKKLYDKTISDNNKNNRLRVGTFNILGFKDKNTYSSQLASYSMIDNCLDVCGIQEMRSTFDYVGEWWITTQNIMDKCYFRPSFAISGGGYGLGVVSCHNLTNCTGGNYDMSVDTTKEQRCYTKSDININGKTVRIYNTHLTHDNVELVKDEIKQLANIIQNDNTQYKIVSGDFNTFDLSAFKPLVDIGYTPCFDVSSNIDNVVIPYNIKMLKRQIVEVGVGEFVSDHNLYFVELELI